MVSVLFISFVICLAIGIPVAFSLGVASCIYFIGAGMPINMFAQKFFAGMDSFTLLCIPGFTLAGNLMNQGGISDKLLDFAETCVGHLRGGLAYANVLASMVFAGISGTALADTVALGGIEIPMMVNQGYDVPFSVAVTAASSCMGPIIPPSMLMVVYGAYGGVSVASMFLAGLIPGVFIALFMMITIYHWAKKYPSIKLRERRASLKEIWQAFRRSILALLVPVIIIAGVLGGKFTATESGMIAAVYSLLVTAFVYRSITLGDFVQIVKKTLLSMAGPMFCAAGAGAFGYMMAYLQIPKLVLELSGPVNGNRYLTLLFLFGLFLILGCFMDAIPAIIIFLPISQELSNAAGLDPLHVAILSVVTLCYGFVTPPYGLTMLLSASIAGVPSTAVIKRTVPFYLSFLAVAVIIIFFPDVILLLPRMLLGA